MKTVLYLSYAGAQFWRKERQGWQTCTDPGTRPVWVVTDWAEEHFVQLEVPRIFGADRRAFLAHQLASRFPDTVFRLVLPAPAQGGLMQRLAPPHQVLLGVEAAPRLNDALDALSAPLAGVWTTSLLLAQMGSHPSLPADVLIIWPSASALRIVFMKNHAPVLTRLIPGVKTSAEQAEEIIRTLRHLENTRALQRGLQRCGVWLLGHVDAQMQTLLADQALDMVPMPTPWPNTLPDQWLFVLFDKLLTSPVGQLAPLPRRYAFIAHQVRPLAYGAAALGLGAALWAGAANWSVSTAYRIESVQIQRHVQALQAQQSQLEQRVAAFGVPAPLVRQVVALEQQQLRGAPSLAAQMGQLADVISHHEKARLSQFKWRILAPGQPACIQPSATPASPPEAPEPNVQASAPLRAEISLTLLLPDDLLEKDRAELLTALSVQLKQLKGVAVLDSPSALQGQTVLSNLNNQSLKNSAPAWCLTLAGVAP